MSTGSRSVGKRPNRSGLARLGDTRRRRTEDDDSEDDAPMPMPRRSTRSTPERERHARRVNDPSSTPPVRRSLYEGGAAAGAPLYHRDEDTVDTDDHGGQSMAANTDDIDTLPVDPANDGFQPSTPTLSYHAEEEAGEAGSQHDESDADSQREDEDHSEDEEDDDGDHMRQSVSHGYGHVATQLSEIGDAILLELFVVKGEVQKVFGAIDRLVESRKELWEPSMRSIVGKLIEGGTFYPTKQELVRAMVNASAPVPVVPEKREHFWSTGDASTSIQAYARSCRSECAKAIRKAAQMTADAQPTTQWDRITPFLDTIKTSARAPAWFSVTNVRSVTFAAFVVSLGGGTRSVGDLRGKFDEFARDNAADIAAFTTRARTARRAR